MKLFSNLEWEGETTDNSIYLTFDDGPILGITEWVLQELRKYDAKASFFCVGNNVKNNPDIYRQIIANGHTAGNHTFSHLKGWRSSNQNYFADIEKAAELVDPLLFRPPYGQIKFSQIRALKKKYRIIMWSLLSCDYDSNLNREKALYYLKKYTKPGSIVVFHDSEKAKENLMWLLPQYLEYCHSQGFNFAAL